MTMTLIVDAVCDHYRSTCGLGGAFTRPGYPDDICLLRVNPAVGAIRIAAALSGRMATRFGRLVIGQVVGAPSGQCVWLTRPVDANDRRNAAGLAGLGVEILPTGSEVRLRGPWDASSADGHRWVGRPPSDDYRVRAADVIAEALVLGRVG
ncbi:MULTISPECIES: hypothetical protein [Nocardia]|uniref:hypothetical protein n=1 Tax=Nocardia TaxID=1817 RepID=UPI0007EBE42C|nr:MULTISPECIES: hypothetical protein [Nocardia]MBF6278647.1 hypothetical protein [Nocardia nova]OBA56499.1 hypothetical protein A5789_00015 [Nocardia sp. 852002-51101_SCH5132738]OBB46871.1 hypothetical protein A5748_24185 [Nocardia sp. 852002-51244_SCH5132740]OBF77191.1 hypothetical protein A9X06_24050 [Mycobacterium sp. 852002-51759_SCH5129042]